MITRIINKNGGRYSICPEGNCEETTEVFGLSTDEKPTLDIHNADVFYEMDTQKVFLFDETNSVWREQ